MTSDPPRHLLRAAALAAGRDTRTAERLVATAARIDSAGGQRVFTLKHLAHLTGAPYIYLRDVVARRRDPYLDIVRPKKGGETRAIASPEPVLMDVQRWLLQNVVVSCGTHPASFAYQRERSIVCCARQHLGARWLIKLDLHDFFHSVNEQAVFRVLVEKGYPRLLSLEMARLCTRPPEPQQINRNYWAYQDKAPYAVNQLGYLPQGAPTSGALANSVMVPTDARLAAHAESIGLTYTRYSDDLTFSASGDFSRGQATRLIGRVTRTLAESGFRVHQAKTRVVPPGARHIVLGLVVDGDSVRLPPKFRRRLDSHIRGVSTFGLAAHAHHRHFQSVLSMINHIDGCIAFAHGVDTTYSRDARERWNATLVAQGFNV